MRPLADPVDRRPLHEVTDDWRARHRPMVEDCVCGGEVRAETGRDGDIIVAVRQHQIEPVHIAYDIAHGIPLAGWQLRATAIDGGLRDDG